MPGLVQVEGLVLDSMANAILALDGVTGEAVSLSPGFCFLHTGTLSRFCESFRLMESTRDGTTCSVTSLNRSLWRHLTEERQNIHSNALFIL